ncbi:FHA domain-containing protein [Candidatus Woesearchaeota archaeon]|nr:FHA domain-containing protein [Candidatus Woesearchaeota archaeon]
MAERESGENPLDLKTLGEYRQVYFGSQERFFKAFEGVPFLVEIINPSKPHKEITPEFMTPTDPNPASKKSNAGAVFLESDIHPVRKRIWRSYVIAGSRVEQPANKDPHVTIGREAISDIIIHDHVVSGLHARIMRVETEGRQTAFYLVDNNSKNKTYVLTPDISLEKDDLLKLKPLAPGVPHQLQTRDYLRFGNRLFCYVDNPQTMYYFIAAKG